MSCEAAELEIFLFIAEMDAPADDMLCKVELRDLKTRKITQLCMTLTRSLVCPLSASSYVDHDASKIITVICVGDVNPGLMLLLGPNLSVDLYR